MKRFALILTTVAALAIFSTSSANAFDYGHGGHGYVGHGYVGHEYGYGGGHGYAVPSHGYGYAHGGYYARPVHRVHGYRRSYGVHGGGLRISTPHFGIRLGH